VFGIALFLASSSCVFAQSRENTGVLKGSAAFGDWRDDRPGVRRLLAPHDLPAVSSSAQNLAEIVPRPAGAEPAVPPGFRVELVASGISNPRAIRLAPNGDLFVADSMANRVRVFRVPDGSARPSRDATFATNLRQPFGIAFYPPGPNPEWIYVANSDSVVRFPYRDGDLTASGEPQRIIERMPWVHHWTRDILFSLDGNRLFLSIGAGSDVALDMFPEPLFAVYPTPHVINSITEWIHTSPLGAAWDTEERRANVLSFDPDGQDEKTVATGLRNCAGLTVQPATGQLWCVVNERGDLGDNTPFDYATAIKEGAFYGWPWYYIGSNEEPRHRGSRPDLKDRVTVPDVLMQAHSAPLQIVFYQANAFPASYKGSAFVTFHGSSNRANKTGYKVVRLLFDANGKPSGEYEDFMTGFVVSDKQVWGRPVGVAVAKDGSLFVSEDGNGTIWRVSYERPATRE
jgi:glucose/arabinose dehydrogenase